MNGLAQDVRYGFRMLGRNPSFTFTAIFVLAIGIGSTTLIFSVVDHVLLRPLPYRNPDSLILLEVQRTAHRPDVLELQDFDALKQQPQLFETLSAYFYAAGVFQSEEGPERINGKNVTTNFFETLGVHPFAGRVFASDDTKANASFVVVISYGFWQSRLGGDPEAIGRTIQLDNQTYTIVGIMPVDFQDPHPGAKVECWTPIEKADAFRDPSSHIEVIGRVIEGVSTQQLNAFLAAASARVPSLNDDPGGRIIALSVVDLILGSEKSEMSLLLGAVGFVLVLACVNLAHLLLARVPERQSEITIRAALGGRRLTLIRQLLIENVIVALSGGAAGLLVAWWTLPVVLSLTPSFTRIDRVAIDPRIVAFVFAVSIVTAVGFGLGPALALVTSPRRLKLSRAGIVGSVSRSLSRYQGTMLVSEIALSMILLIGAGLLLRTYWLTRPVDLGFSPSQKTTAIALLPWTKYESPVTQIAYYRQALEAIESLPGIREVAAASFLPAGDIISRPLIAEDGHDNHGERALASSVSPNFFRVLEIPLVAGRLFDETDTNHSERIVVVNETLAQKLWPHGPAIGKMLKFGGDLEKAIAHRVIGVVADTRSYAFQRETVPTLYAPFLQDPADTVQFIVTGAPFSQIARPLREAMLTIEPAYPIRIQPMETMYWTDQTIVQRRFHAWLIGTFAAIAVVLALVGVFGTIAYRVRQRRQEIGLRVALGADSHSVVRLFVVQGMLLIVSGLVIGLAGSLALTRLIESQLAAVSPLDPWTYLLATSLIAVTGFAAVYLPARRTTEVDPMLALRHE